MITRIQTKTGASLRSICRVLGLPRSSFYHAARKTESSAAETELGDLIETIFREHRRRYGYRRIVAELRDREIKCGPSRVRRIMKRRGLKAIQPRSFVPRTSDGKANCPSPNLVAERSHPVKTDEIRAGDITYIPTEAGWLYLAVIIDLCSRRVVGWNLGDEMRAELVTSALQQAIACRRRTGQTIFHSDRGSQYSSRSYRSALSKARIQQSMSRRANPYDNAWTESFIGTLKLEMLQKGCSENADDARMEIFEYIEGYYNTKRRHSALGYKSPNQFEIKLQTIN